MKTSQKQRKIVRELAEKKTVEQMVQTICKVTNVLLDDLSQCIYLALLEYDSKKLEKLYNSGELQFFIVRIIQNQWFSKTSPFWHSHRKFSRRANEIVTVADKI